MSIFSRRLFTRNTRRQKKGIYLFIYFLSRRKRISQERGESTSVQSKAKAGQHTESSKSLTFLIQDNFLTNQKGVECRESKEIGLHAEHSVFSIPPASRVLRPSITFRLARHAFCPSFSTSWLSFLSLSPPFFLDVRTSIRTSILASFGTRSTFVCQGRRIGLTPPSPGSRHGTDFSITHIMYKHVIGFQDLE